MLILLCGPPGCGKSSIGQILSKELSVEFIDTDKMIEKRFGDELTIGEIFLREGENNFRAIEKEIIRSIGSKKAVIALGGGIKEINDLKGDRVVIYLKTDVEILWDSVQKRAPLPAYLQGPDKKKEFINLVTNRLPRYEAMADIIVDNTFPRIGDLVEQIINLEVIKNGR